MENQKKYDVIALGELLIDFTPAGTSAQGNPVLEQNPGGAPCNVLAMLARYGRSTGFIGKIGNDIHGRFLCRAVREAGIGCGGLVMSDEVHTPPLHLSAWMSRVTGVFLFTAIRALIWR